MTKAVVVYIPDTEGHGDDIEGIVPERQGKGIPLDDPYPFRQLSLVDLGGTRIEHLLDEIEAGHAHSRVFPCRGNGEIGRSRGHIEEAIGFEKGHSAHRETTPRHVAPQAQEMVEEIVSSRDGGEDFLDHADALFSSVISLTEG